MSSPRMATASEILARHDARPRDISPLLADARGRTLRRMVRKERLELSRVAPLEPKSSASTNSATLAIAVTVPITMAGSTGPRGRGACKPCRGKDGGPCRARTYDQLIKSQLLYQLS